MADRAPGEAIKWYRCPLSKAELAEMNRRSDLMGFAQTLGYLGVLAITGSAAYFSAGRAPWPVVVLLTYLHGTCWAFMINGFHELLHDSVFKTRGLNRFFLGVFSFFSQWNHHAFWASHTEHHKYTLHTPDDHEVVLPTRFTLLGFLRLAILNTHHTWWGIWTHLRHASGRMEGHWECELFKDKPNEWKKPVNWARFVLAGHTALLAAFCYFQLWMLIPLVTLVPYYGGGLQFLCNAVQHAGLTDNKPDFRLCCRSIHLNPVFQFLYWHMNYHTEHHMYAAVPCYNLAKLHRLIKHDMPHCPNGLYESWKVVIEIQERQKADPSYQFIAVVPAKPIVAAPVPEAIPVSA